jgi:hypothetical protein
MLLHLPGDVEPTATLVDFEINGEKGKRAPNGSVK